MIRCDFDRVVPAFYNKILYILKMLGLNPKKIQVFLKKIPISKENLNFKKISENSKKINEVNPKEMKNVCATIYLKQ